VIVKAHVMRLGGSGAKAAALHLRYIARDGVEKDGSKGLLYGVDGLVRAASFDQPRFGERHQFRFVVSPEDAGELDLTAYVRQLMATVERDLGRKLEWAAVNHYDTDHPHAHVVLRGVDRAGREVRLDRGYIAQGLRWRAQELATEELGPRLEVDVRRARAKEIAQERFTSLDRELERRAVDGRVEVRSRARLGRLDESVLIARLEHLEGLRLAERVGPASWVLASGWKGELRELGARGDILKQMHRAIAGDRARYRIVRPGQSLSVDGGSEQGIRLGRVASKGLSDEVRGAFYAVLETPSGDAYHVPLDARGAEQLRPGNLVSFTTQPEAAIRAVDRRIAKLAAAGDGTCDLAPTPADALALERRLRYLERLGLADPEAPHRWNVSPNLLRVLEERHRDGPVRHRLLVRKEPLSLEGQVHHPGLVWLDRIEIGSLAPFGFGAALRGLIERRGEALRQLGIEPHDPKRSAKLRDLERRGVGNDVALRSGQTFVANAPDAFRGRVERASASPRRSDFVVVSDGRRFVVVRATPSLLAAEGKAVLLTRDARGQVLARPDLDKSPSR
jgi:type IV secretory pathway VirD2 relaxase